MKKTIAILLVAIMAVGSVFAAITGSAQIGVGANFDNGNYGFIDNSNSVDINFELTNQSGEAVGEGDIYASIKGSLVLEVFQAENAYGDLDEDGVNEKLPFYLVGDWGDKSYIGLGASIDEAKIAGQNWYVSLLGASDAPDYAKSAIDTYDKAVKKYDIVTDSDGATGNASLGIGWQGVKKGNGVEVGIYDYVIGGAFYGDWKKDTIDVIGYVATPNYDFNGLTLQVAAAGAKGNGSGSIDGGLSAKVGFANDTLSASVATDLVLGIPTVEGNDVKFDADVAANFTYDFLTVDAYYGTNPKTKDDGTKIENLLSAQVVTDLNSFDVPVKVTVSGKDLINKQDLDLSVEFKVASLTLTPSVGYVIGDEKFNAGLKAQYDHEYVVAKAEASVVTGFDKASTTLKASASVENSTLIPGATLKLEWKDAKDLLNTQAENSNYGKVIASVKVEFLGALLCHQLVWMTSFTVIIQGCHQE